MFGEGARIAWWRVGSFYGGLTLRFVCVLRLEREMRNSLDGGHLASVCS